MNIKSLLIASSLLLWSLPAWAAHGLSLDGTLKYPANFTGFAYTSDKAKVGGTLTLHAMGSFDKMNPYTLKGEAPALLSQLVFEPLTIQALDEPFTHYGLLAQDIAVAADGLSITYKLRPEARFSDGSPITATDVQYSFDLLKSDKAHPLYQSYWRDVEKAIVVDTHTVRLTFARKNRELPLIIGDLPLLNKNFYSAHPFDKEDLAIPVGSGPYLVERVDAGKSITYRRNPDYWGWKQPTRRGMFNFERIVVKYFKDDVVAQEGFKAGEFDFIHENNSKQWARDYDGEKFTNKTIIKEHLPHKNGVGMQGFVFNLRRPLFKDIRVRQALGLAFDFEWSNKNLFYEQYTRSESYFSNSELAASGLPSPEELKLLEPLRAQLNPTVFEAVKRPPSTLPPSSLRDNLLQAKTLLEAAGWKVGKDNLLTNSAGQKLKIETVLVSAAFERIMAPYAANLKKLGIQLDYRTVDSSLYQRRMDDFDFDMVVGVFPQSQSPGNEQRGLWHSSSATVKGSRNLLGLQDPAVDTLVDKIIYAATRAELITACRALDRVLLSGYYVVPNYHIPFHRIAYWNQFERPDTIPLYYSPEEWLITWWRKPQ